jgi:hypothetical protein
MDAALGRKLRFSDAVYAVETTPKALRNWLQRKQVVLDTPTPVGGWLEFSLADIAILALVRRLVDFGLGVAVASTIANKALKFSWTPTRRSATKRDVSAFTLSLSWAGARLIVYRTKDGKWDLVPPVKHFPTRILGVGDDDWYRAYPEPADTYISVNVEDVLERAFGRALKSAEGMEGKV